MGVDLCSKYSGRAREEERSDGRVRVRTPFLHAPLPCASCGKSKAGIKEEITLTLTLTLTDLTQNRPTDHFAEESCLASSHPVLQVKVLPLQIDLLKALLLKQLLLLPLLLLVQAKLLLIVILSNELEFVSSLSTGAS